MTEVLPKLHGQYCLNVSSLDGLILGAKRKDVSNRIGDFKDAKTVDKILEAPDFKE